MRLGVTGQHSVPDVCMNVLRVPNDSVRMRVRRPRLSCSERRRRDAARYLFSESRDQVPPFPYVFNRLQYGGIIMASKIKPSPSPFIPFGYQLGSALVSRIFGRGHALMSSLEGKPTGGFVAKGSAIKFLLPMREKGRMRGKCGANLLSPLGAKHVPSLNG